MEEQKLSQLIDISHYMIDEETLNLVVPGDLITSEEGFIKYPLPHPADTAPTARTPKYTPLLSAQSKPPTS
jgi:hypothetical protein